MTPEIFSKRLNDLMELEGISKRALSLRINSDRKSIRYWVNGKFFPRYDALIKLSVFFKVPVDYLIGLENWLGNEESYQPEKGLPIEQVPKRFCEILSGYMSVHNLTRYAVSKKLEIDQKTLTKWLTKGSMPETATLIKLAKLMNTSVNVLLGRE